MLSSGVLIVSCCVVTVLYERAVIEDKVLFGIITAVLLFLCSCVTYIIRQQPESKTKLSFKVSGLQGMSGAGKGRKVF